MTMASTSAPGRQWNAARRLPGRMSLRVKLISALLALVTVALAVISIAGISVLKSYLLAQADQQLASLIGQGQYGLVNRDMLGYLQNTEVSYQPGVSVAWIPSGGRLQQVVQPEIVTGFGPRAHNTPVPGPAVPTADLSPAASASHPLTVAAETGPGRWRVAVLPTQITLNGTVINGTVVVGVDVTDEYATIGQLTSIDLVVSAVILIVLALVGVTVVRASLRPLTEIEQTAEGIAAGDLTGRVPDRDPRTEVGRLGRSLNAMLSQIESAFRARADSETAARRSEERMRQFVADASHELRTPLTAIRGFAEYYRQRGGLEPGGSEQGALAAGSSGSTEIPGGQVRDLPAASSEAWGPLTRADLNRIMRRVEQESSRMGVLVEDMLLLARLEQQRPLENRPVDLLTLAADAVHDARVMAPRRSIDLAVVPGAAPIVLGDEVRLRQVIGNLMSNALIHTPDGTPVEVRIRPGTLDEGRVHAVQAVLPPSPELAAGPAAAAGTGSAGQPGPGPAAGPALAPEAGTASPAVILEVADRGPGLTPDQAERAFERFYRADQARARRAGGSGLGLAIVAALVVAHGGTVSVEPTPGDGATFRIALPLAPEVLGPGPDSESAPAGQPAPAGEGGPSGAPAPDREHPAGHAPAG
jgi:two-component system, OmpR family, sensor kinase